jgi:two-component system, chemotaxis family, sensor kinase CheA
MASIAEEVERLTEMLRDSVRNIRMLPIGATRFKRLVRDLATELGEKVELVTEIRRSGITHQMLRRTCSTYMAQLTSVRTFVCML